MESRSQSGVRFLERCVAMVLMNRRTLLLVLLGFYISHVVIGDYMAHVDCTILCRMLYSVSACHML